QPPLLRIGSRRARTVGPSGDHATRARQVHNRVYLVAVRHVNDVATHIVCCHEPIRTDLSLDAEAPLVRVRRFHVVRSPVVLRGRRWKWRVGTEDKWKWISARNAIPRIVETARRRGKRHLTAKRSLIAGITVRLQVRIVEKDSV